MNFGALSKRWHVECEVQVRINDALEEGQVRSSAIVKRPVQIERLARKGCHLQTHQRLLTKTSKCSFLFRMKDVSLIDSGVVSSDLDDARCACLLLAHAANATVATAAISLLSQNMLPQLPTIRVTLLRNLGKRPDRDSPCAIAAFSVARAVPLIVSSAC